MNKVNKEFYLLRHGQTEFNAKKMIAGYKHDCPINETGKEQAKDVRPLVANLKIETIFHSPMLRVVQTMNYAAKDHECDRIELDLLKECDSDVWHKLTRIEQDQFPCEETLPFYEQVEKMLDEILEHPGTPLLVTHGGIHYALCHQLQIIDHPWKIDNCALVHFYEIEDEWHATLI